MCSTAASAPPPDEQILAFARANGYVVCTLDADFHSILGVSGSAGPSVVRVRREGLRGPALASLLKRVWEQVGGAIESGAAITVTDRAVRLRRLPITGERAISNSWRICVSCRQQHGCSCIRAEALSRMSPPMLGKNSPPNLTCGLGGEEASEGGWQRH